MAADGLDISTHIIEIISMKIPVSTLEWFRFVTTEGDASCDVDKRYVSNVVRL